MFLSRRFQFINKLTKNRYINSISHVSMQKTDATANNEEIEVPNRIHRSSTDILYALASTVGRDPTAPHYKYHDDPFLIPVSNMSKRTYAMAQESGRKAAKWIREQHRELFLHQEAQPAIEEFVPKMVFNEESVVDNTTLNDLILRSQVTDAVFVYNLMKEKNIEVTTELKQSLLELICFYNNVEPLPEEFIEERWFKQNNETRDRSRKTWKDGDLAEQIFNEIEPKTTSTYAAIIRGMAKYYQVERAYAMFEQALEKQIDLDTTTFNAILGVTNFLKETADQRWELCRQVLQQMATLQIKPNLGTMNSLLECLTTFGNYKFARSCALQVLAEFKLLNVRPSLGTYYYILTIFCRDRSPVSHVIVDILNEIQDKEFSIEHHKDTYFFVTAMDVCRNHLHDKSIARKVDALLHTGNNYNLIGDSFKESVYYRHYFALLCQTEPVEEFMQTYDKLVPNIYIPEPGVMEELLKAVELNAAIELVPRLWSDMIIFDHLGRESLINRILNIMVSNKPDISIPIQEQLPQQFAKVALDIYNKIQETQGRAKKISFTGQMIGDILTLTVRGDDFESASQIFTNIDKNQHRIPGTPSETSLLEFVNSCITHKSPSQAIVCLQYTVENNMNAVAMAKQIHNGFTLNEVHLSKIKSLVGDSYLSD
ncbi:protein PTCD3 homolog, mitochondrial-like [Teleopsis dalmanni]|uniref:protein PTCD3 homolog, mitochondrial-like n=1 Tax=Teleopsis dalmanni TaxID=139649 RepID=UPI0018CF0823|nr:protein PTCD3 homolog, mitochondrial-like [Teleopsis dalmanni]